MPLYKNYKHGDDFSLIIPKQYIQYLSLVHIDGVVFISLFFAPALRELFSWFLRRSHAHGADVFYRVA